ncbi:XkdW family protein [Paenibacillus sp. CMAA1739]|uniref:XkdW family protein n=1 Tax=Paenibacillus ottowii TaxID=2315729 RepID=UPI0027304850|nr:MULTISPECIES: XkdW family protein [Paenibacillus]MDP1513071.1 XkdW family protein [Paenibacillus ottowii]MEC4569345.1 XkdW family protein [Paenibacillus sp. CMAA1739]
MKKECVVLNSEVINIGPWDYQKRQLQNGVDKDGKPIYEEQVTNPLPEGATFEEREIEVAPDGGLIVKGSAQPTNDAFLGQELAQIKLQSMQQQELLSNMGAELAAARLEIISLKGESGS